MRTNSMLKLIKRPRIITPLNGGFILGGAWQNAEKTIPHQYPIRLNAKGAVLAYGVDDVHTQDVQGNDVEHVHDDEWVYFVDDVGNPLSHGKVWTYYYQSTRPKKSYGDENKTIVNDNPITLDELGRAKIYINGNYRLRVYDKHGVCMGDDDDFGEFEKVKHDKYLTSTTYSTFEKVDNYLISKQYPAFKKQDIKLTSKQYPTFKKVDNYFTSSTYAYIFDDELTISPMGVINGDLYGMATSFNDELALHPISVKSVELKSILNHHEFNDELVLHPISVKSVELVSILKTNSFNDELTLNPMTVKSVELTNVKITHDFGDELLLQPISVKGAYYE